MCGMTIELVGIVTLIAGFYILRRGPDVGIVLLFCASLLGAAAAFKLPALGGANIMPAHALLPFYCLAVLRTRGGFGNALSSLSFPRPESITRHLAFHGGHLQKNRSDRPGVR